MSTSKPSGWLCMLSENWGKSLSPARRYLDSYSRGARALKRQGWETREQARDFSVGAAIAVGVAFLVHVPCAQAFDAISGNPGAFAPPVSGYECNGATIESPGLSGRIDKVLGKFVSEGGPGAEVALVVGGAIRHLKGYGPADLDNGKQWNAAIRYPLGSITESLTASAVFDLAEAGKLGLTDAITQYVPFLSQAAHAVSIADLLTMSSGLWDTGELMAIAGDTLIASPERGASLELADSESYLAHQTTLDFRPETQYRRSSTNYRILAQVIEKATGVSFATAMRDIVLAQAGMGRAEIISARNAILPCSAAPYLASAGHWRNLAAVALTTSGDGAAVASMLDMIAWMGYMSTLSTTDGESKFARQADLRNRLAGPEAFYRVGLMLFRHAGYVGVGNLGDTGTLYVYFPDLSLALLVFSNDSSALGRGAIGLRKLAAELIDVYLKSYPDAWRQTARFAQDAAALPLAAPGLSPNVFAAGAYVSPATGEVLEIKPDGDRVLVELMGKPIDSWWQVSQQWHGAGIQAHIVLLPGKSEETDVIELAEGDFSDRRSFARVIESDIAPQVAQGLTGWYLSEALQTYYRIGIANGVAYLAIKDDLRPSARLPLTQLSQGVFRAGGLFLFESKTSACEAAEFIVSTSRVRNVPFARVQNDDDRFIREGQRQGLINCQTGSNPAAFRHSQSPPRSYGN